MAGYQVEKEEVEKELSPRRAFCGFLPGSILNHHTEYFGNNTRLIITKMVNLQPISLVP
jgi:hypothetical protein